MEISSEFFQSKASEWRKQQDQLRRKVDELFRSDHANPDLELSGASSVRPVKSGSRNVGLEPADAHRGTIDLPWSRSVYSLEWDANRVGAVKAFFPETGPGGGWVESPQSPPKFREYSLFARLSLVFATRGGYKPFGC